MEADPTKQRTIALARALSLALRFDPRASQEEVDRAEYRIRLAQEGDLGVYQAEEQAFQTRYVEQLREWTKPALEQSAKAQLEINEWEGTQ
jgi:hypothetical protein